MTPLSCDLRDTSIDVEIRDGSRCAQLYARTTARERTTCRYGLDPALQTAIDASGLSVVGVDGTGEARLVERADHPFFVGSLFLPQFRSEQSTPHPLIAGFVEAAASADPRRPTSADAD